MKKFSIILFFLVTSIAGFSQVKFGPVIDLGMGFYSNTSDSIKLKPGINPSFGICLQKDMNFWLALRLSGTYSFKTLSTAKEVGGAEDKMNGQFFDLGLSGRFSGFDDDVKTLPYGTAGTGLLFTVVSKGQEHYMKQCVYNTAIPYFTVGAGAGFKISFFSEFDLSLNYTRYLFPMFSTPLDNKDARLNQVSLKVAALF
ncbi:MAG: outer membrane beta-barrel protein [Bacteroidales bacterium]|nr:outer membrane beta-barrel protein [Bacteroidales bacterium]